MTLRWGLLSTARINDKLLAAAPDRFVAVGSRDQARADEYARAHSLERAHGSYEALLADPEVDAVYISLPNGMHYEWSVKALDAGKHVLCEKPFTRHTDEVERAFDLADERRLVLAEAFMWRHNPLLARARELIAEGAVGELRLVRAVFSFVLADPGDVRFSRGLAGGALMDLGCYCVSGCRALTAAEPETFSAEQVQGGDGVDLSTAGVMRFPNDVLATIDCSFGMTPRDELEAIGTAGSLFIDSPWHATPATIEVRSPAGIEHLEIGQSDSYALELEDFEAAVAGEREPLLGRADALGQARAIAALYEAAGKGL